MEIEYGRKFRYLGSIISEDGGCKDETNKSLKPETMSQTRVATKSYKTLNTIWKNYSENLQNCDTTTRIVCKRDMGNDKCMRAKLEVWKRNILLRIFDG